MHHQPNMTQEDNMKQHYQWPALTVGTCYYPEHWPEELWPDDLRRMLDSGITVIRVGEFAWSKFELHEGEFTFDFFDRFLDLCAEMGMKVIFGTPTATPPAWLTEKYPEVLNCSLDGVLYRHGGRRHYNYNAPVYQRLCARMVEQLARHYGHHPAIVGWQIDNEINCETCDFYSEADSVAFRDFLRKKYGTLDALNDAWGTVFWNQTYTDWAQVYVPRPTATPGVNPHLLLDYSRFVSDSAIRFCRIQADILRQHVAPGVFITTNGLFANLDNHRFADECLDVMTYDSYPSFAFELDHPWNPDAMNDRGWSRMLSEVRSVCPHFGIMEQKSGANGWYNRMEGPAPRPGQLTLWAMQSVAHGADFVSFFRWRTCTMGTEIYWHGILDYDNRDNRRLQEVRAFTDTLQRMKDVCGADSAARVALVKDYDNEWDARHDRWHQRVQQRSETGVFEGTQRTHTPCDTLYLRESTDLSELRRYDVLIYPHATIVTPERAELLTRYVEAGGTLMIGCRTGYKDGRGHCVMQPQPGLLRALAGANVRDFTFHSPAEEPPFALLDGERLETPLFNDVLEAESANVLARYAAGYYAGEPALTENKVGKGRVLYLGAPFCPENTAQLLRRVSAAEPYGQLLQLPETVELTARRKDGRLYLFLLNYQPAPAECRVHAPAQALVRQGTVQGAFTLPPYGVEVLTMEDNL